MNWFWFKYAKVLSTVLSELCNDRRKRSRRWSIIYEELKMSDAFSPTTFKTCLKQLFQATLILCKSVKLSVTFCEKCQGWRSCSNESHWGCGVLGMQPYIVVTKWQQRPGRTLHELVSGTEGRRFFLGSISAWRKLGHRHVILSHDVAVGTWPFLAGPDRIRREYDFHVTEGSVALINVHYAIVVSHI